MWIAYSIGTAVLLALSALFAKCGVKRAHPTVVTSLRTLVIAIFAWVVFFTSGSSGFSAISGTSFLYIALTGAAFAAAMICYHSALKKGDLVRVSALEKAASFLMMLIAVVLYNRTSLLYIRIIAMALLAVGIILMLTKKSRAGSGTVILYGMLYAVAAVAAHVLDSTGINVRNSALSLALILTVVLIVSLVSSFVCGLSGGTGRLPMSELMFTLLSGFSAGLAWLGYRYAMSNGDTSTVTVIISMSFAVSVGLASLFLKEKVSWKTICGMLLIAVGILMYEFMI